MSDLPTTVTNQASVTRGDPAAWREWHARCRDAADAGRLVTDLLSRDDYPGSDAGWRVIEAADERIRRSRRRTPPADTTRHASQPRSSLPPALRRSIDELDDTPPVARAADWLAGWHARHTGKGLLLVGPVGTGKTTIAAAIAHDAGEPNYAAFTTAQDYIADQHQHLRDRPGGPSPLDRLCDKPVLVVDDLGRESSAWQRGHELLVELITRRYDVERKRRDRQGRRFTTVLTSNLPSADREDRYGEMVASRLAEMVEPVAVTGDDRRRTEAA